MPKDVNYRTHHTPASRGPGLQLKSVVVVCIKPHKDITYNIRASKYPYQKTSGSQRVWTRPIGTQTVRFVSLVPHTRSDMVYWTLDLEDIDATVQGTGQTW